jgi:arsenate reductase-like glutaredoxin family protein
MILLTLIALATVAGVAAQGASGTTPTAKQNPAQDDLQVRLNQTQQQLNQTQQQLNQTQKQLDQLKTQNDLLKAQLTNATSQLNHHILRRPTLQELQTFLLNNKPNLPASNRTDPNCVQFSSDLKKFAAVAGLNISYVQVNYVATWKGKQYGYGHALNGAYLADGTWVYIEPQTGEVSQSLEHLITELVFLPMPFQITMIGVVW